MATETETIIARLEKLERQNKRLRQVGIVSLLLLAVLVVAGVAAPSRTIEAEKFVLKDVNGKTRAELLSNDAGPDLRLLDENGIIRLSVSIYAGVPNIALFSPDSKQVATLVADDTGSQLWFGTGPTEKPLAAIGTNLTLGKDGKLLQGSFVRLCDRKGHDRVELEYSPLFNEASLQVYGANEKETVGISAGDAIAPSLFVSFGRNAVSLSSDKDGAAVSIGDDRGFSTSIGSTSLITGATGETHRTSAASLVLFDKAKSVIWKAP
jgi:hypothetical protein